MSDPIFDGLERTMKRRALEYACGRAITCPSCGHILDRKRAVLLTGKRAAGIACVDCIEKQTINLVEMREAGFEIDDGRELYPTRKRARKA